MLPTSEQLNKNEDNNLLEIVRGLQKRVSQLERRPAAKTNFANAAGAHVIVGTGDPFDINNPFTGTAILFPAYIDPSGEYHVFGMNAGVLQWGANSLDGKIYFGGGDGFLDEYGLFFMNQEGQIGFQDLATGGFDSLNIFSDGADDLVLYNGVGGKGVRFDIDDASHNVRQHIIDYDGVDLQAGATYEIGGVSVLTATTRPIVAHMTHWASATVPASTTYYCMGYIDGNSGTTERAMPVLRPGTVKNLYVRILGNQPASGSLVVTVRKNTADTAVTFTVAAGYAGGAATFSDITHSFSVVAGDFLGVKFVNNATAASAPIGFVAFEIECTP